MPVVMIMIVYGVFLLLPVLALQTTVSTNNARSQDETLMYYAASAGIQGIISDLAMGADPRPTAPAVYSPPRTTINGVTPEVSTQAVQSDVLTISGQIAFNVDGEPVITQGTLNSGSGADLATVDGNRYVVQAGGTPKAVEFEVVSQSVTFDSVTFVTINFTGQSDKDSTKVKFFVYNPDDPEHMDGGYNSEPDSTLTMPKKNKDNVHFFFLNQTDVDYVNSLATSTVKIKVRANRGTQNFKLKTDQINFEVAGVTSTDTKGIDNDPELLVGTYISGGASDLASDDGSFYTVSGVGSSPKSLTWIATSSPFGFAQLETVSVELVAESDEDSISVEAYVYNPDDPAHTNGGYDPSPDMTLSLPTKNVSASSTLALSTSDVEYVNSLPDKEVTVKVIANNPADTAFVLNADMLAFTGVSSSTPLQVVGQPKLQYFDPGLKNPALARVQPDVGYLLRLHDVKDGLFAVNWAFEGKKATIQVFRGMPTDGGIVIPPGIIDEKPGVGENDLVTRENSKAQATQVLTKPTFLEAGVYSVVFWNDSNDMIVTKPFHASASMEDTWIWGVAFRDLLITATATDAAGNKATVKAVVRQTPGRTEPPEYPWARDNISWMANETTIMAWEPP